MNTEIFIANLIFYAYFTKEYANDFLWQFNHKITVTEGDFRRQCKVFHIKN